IIAVLAVREEIINTLLSTGIDIYAMEKERLKAIIPEEFVNTIIKIKYCIYEGFKLNIAWFDNEIMKYKLQHGNLEILIPPIFNNDEIKESNDKKYGITWKSVPNLIMYDRL